MTRRTPVAPPSQNPDAASSVADPAPTTGYDGYHRYLPIDDALFQSGFYVTSAGCGVIHPGQPSPPVPHPTPYQFNWDDGRILPEFSLVLITAGRGNYETRATGRLPVRAGDALLVFPGVWHRYRSDPTTGWTEHWMQFNGDFAHRLVEAGAFTPASPVLACPNIDALTERHRALLNSIRRDPTTNTLTLSLLALAVLAGLAEVAATASAGASTTAIAPPPGKTADPLIEAAIRRIWTDSRSVASAAALAGELDVSLRTLERRMHAARGHSVLDEITDCKFSRARHLLRETTLALDDVAARAGFGQAETMRKVFVRRTMMTPGEFRRHSASS